ncbi:hypothetical protein ACFLS9_07795 [Bacteroidota bacterium]
MIATKISKNNQLNKLKANNSLNNNLRINLESLLYDMRLTLPELSKRSDISKHTLYAMAKRGTVTIPLMRKLESALGQNLDKYIIRPDIVN